MAKTKAKCIVREYYDKRLERYIKKDEEISCDSARIAYLSFKGMVKPIEDLSNEETKSKDKTATTI